MDEKQKRANSKNNKSEKKKFKVTVTVICAVLILGAASFFGAEMYIKGKLDKMQHVAIPQDDKSLGISTDAYNNISNTDDSITNILLLGTDSRSAANDSGNSDSMMVLTIDKKNKQLKITSIMRDSIVNVEGSGLRKLTEAHGIGGPLLTMKTINQNYNLNIRDYIEVNFVGLSKIIDYIGGLPINLTADEASFKHGTINSYIDEISSIEKVQPQHITTPGLHNLNGIQAVAYARIRYIGNNDFQRTERQRTVLSAIFRKLATTNVANIGGVADTIAPYIQTSLKSSDMLSLANYAVTHKMTSFEQNRVPYDGMWSSQSINGEDGLAWNKQATIDKLHQFIFGSSK